MPKPVLPSQSRDPEDRSAVHKRRETLEVLASLTVMEGICMEWMLDHADMQRGRVQ